MMNFVKNSSFRENKTELALSCKEETFADFSGNMIHSPAFHFSNSVLLSSLGTIDTKKKNEKNIYCDQ